MCVCGRATRASFLSSAQVLCDKLDPRAAHQKNDQSSRLELWWWSPPARYEINGKENRLYLEPNISASQGRGMSDFHQIAFDTLALHQIKPWLTLLQSAQHRKPRPPATIYYIANISVVQLEFWLTFCQWVRRQMSSLLLLQLAPSCGEYYLLFLEVNHEWEFFLGKEFIKKIIIEKKTAPRDLHRSINWETYYLTKKKVSRCGVKELTF